MDGKSKKSARKLLTQKLKSWYNIEERLFRKPIVKVIGIEKDFCQGQKVSLSNNIILKI